MKSSNEIEKALYESSNSSISITKKDGKYFNVNQFKDIEKIRRFIRKENVRKITFSEIASEIQEDDAIESWTEFQRNLNTEFSKRVQNALKKGTAVVEKNFKSLDCRLGFLEMAMEKNLAMETILIVSKVELKKDRELAKQLASRNLLKGIDKIYFL